MQSPLFISPIVYVRIQIKLPNESSEPGFVIYNDFTAGYTKSRSFTKGSFESMGSLFIITPGFS